MSDQTPGSPPPVPPGPPAPTNEPVKAPGKVGQKKSKATKAGPPKLHLVPSASKKSPKKGEPAPPSQDPAAAVPSPPKQVGKGINARCAPDEMRCNMLIVGKDGEKKRCTRYTVKKVEGGRSLYCLAHDDTPASRAKMLAAGKAGGEATNEDNSPAYKELEQPVGRRLLLTQDDIAAERQRIMYQLARGKIPAAAGNALLSGLQQASTHIEMFGGKQGVEGGAGYLRLMPGVKLIEQLDDKNRPLTSEEMKLIYERQELDVRRGKKPPKTWQECILLYLGMAREPEVAYDEKQEPIGEYRCELLVDPVTKEKAVKRVFVRYRSREMTKQRLADDAEAQERLRQK